MEAPVKFGWNNDLYAFAPLELPIWKHVADFQSDEKRSLLE